MVELQKLNQDVRDKLMSRKAGVYLQCAPATERLVSASKRRLEHWSGFFGREQHHWALDPKTGAIYDPTMEQFNVPWQDCILPEDVLYPLYRGTPSSETLYWASARGRTNPAHLERYLRFKESVGSPSVRKGEEIMVEKVAKNGNKYLLFQAEVYFSSRARSPQFRSATVWRAKRGGHNAYVLTQRCVETKSGKFIFPTKRQVYYIPPDLQALVPLKRGKWQEVVRPAPWLPLSRLIQQAKSWEA
jgi:hypothetical protein